MKSIACRDVGVDCDQKFSGQSDDEIMSQLKPHARDAHGIDSISQDMETKIKSVIKDDGHDDLLNEDLKGGEDKVA